MTFWDHLDELRAVILRCGALVLILSVAAFSCREMLFDFVLAPKSPDFVIYRIFKTFSAEAPDFRVDLINTALARQFIIHMQLSFAAGIIAAAPYTLFEIIRFILPALYPSERRFLTPALFAATSMFALGAAVSYFIIFPLTFQFLGTYQVSSDVPNIITLDSYISTLLSLTLAMGLVFELPILCWILGRMNIITAQQLRQLRRHAYVAILIAAAIITPTGDAFTLLIVTLPILLLYEVSILLMPHQ